MLLKDATSKEQVAAALAEGDEELLDDIEDGLKEAKRRWERDPVVDSDDDIDVEGQITTDKFVDAVIHQSPSEYELANIPREAVVSALVGTPARTYRRRRQYGPFYLDDHCQHFDFSVTRSIHYYFPSNWAPDNAKFIPEDIAKSFWEDLSYRLEWEDTSHVDGDNWAWGEGERACITADESDFVGWCRDTIHMYVRGVIRKDPEKAKETFFKSLATRSGKVAEALKEAKLPDEELLDLASQWFTDDQDDVFATVEEYVSAVTPTGEPNEVIAEWSKQDIVDMGIAKGTLFENAPWKLIKLHASDLRGEGRMMNHCVGTSGMGYIDAVKKGEIEIWSLRSRDNKPRFTLEVDAAFHEDFGPTGKPDPAWRGQHIKQLKGKGNRTPGYADVRRSGGIKFPDEVIFWVNALKQLGADPLEVQDFSAAWDPYPQPPAGARGRMQPNAGEVCTGFDLPYRRGVRQNRRSSKRRSSTRRGSKRRTSRRR
jgi:hypothetical protein